MPLYSFLKLTNNNDPYDFTIECTSMKNGRARISCLRTNLFAWEDAGCVSHFRPVWRYFFLDYSYYVCEKKEFENLQAARVYKQTIYDRYLAKLEKSEKSKITPTL